MQNYTPHPGTEPLTDLILRCYPGDDGKLGSSIVYEDDGVTTGYMHGESAITALTYIRHGDEITINVAATEGSFKGQLTSRRCVVELPCTGKLTSCSLPEAHVSYDDDLQMNRIELPDMPVQKGWTLVIHAAEIDPAVLASRAVAKHLSELSGESPNAGDTGEASARSRGLALITQNMHPYLLGLQTTLLYCHNHQDTPEPVTVTIGNEPGTVVSLRSGDPVPGLPDSAAGLPLATSIPVTVTPSDPSLNGLVLHSQSTAYLNRKDDLASKATVETSSGDAAGVIDGRLGGFPGDRSMEWASNGEKVGAWVKLTWPDAISVHGICLYDRPNPEDNIQAGTLEFDDGTKLDVGVLPNDGQIPAEITFPAKTIHWVKFTVNKVSAKTKNIGLSEIAVF